MLRGLDSSEAASEAATVEGLRTTSLGAFSPPHIVEIRHFASIIDFVDIFLFDDTCLNKVEKALG